MYRCTDVQKDLQDVLTNKKRNVRNTLSKRGGNKNILILACDNKRVILVTCGQEQVWNERGGRETFHYVLFYSFNFCTGSRIF